MTKRTTYAVLAAGIVSISFAAVFIRLADAPPPATAALRLLFASLLLAPAALSSPRTRSEILSLGREEIALLGLSGLFLALHFLSWIWSLSMTGVTSSIVFVTTSPIFIAVYSLAFGGERVSRGMWAGMALAVAGGAIMGGGDLAKGGNSLSGDMLALAGAAAVAGYFIVGRRLRSGLSLLAYVFPVYTTAAVLLCAAAPLLGADLTGLPASAYLYILLMAAVCQVSGHTIFNWALKRMKASVVAMATLGEPAGTTLLAWLIINEIPGPAQAIGGAVVLSGVYVVMRHNPTAVQSVPEGLDAP